jgi:hypothetical protein
VKLKWYFGCLLSITQEYWYLFALIGPAGIESLCESGVREKMETFTESRKFSGL